MTARIRKRFEHGWVLAGCPQSILSCSPMVPKVWVTLEPPRDRSAPKLPLGFLFYSFSSLVLLQTHLPPNPLPQHLHVFAQMSPCPWSLPFLQTVPTHPTLLIPSLIILFSFWFPICLKFAYLLCLLLIVCLSPPECKLHKGRDIYLISSFTYLGNENSAWSRGDNQ